MNTTATRAMNEAAPWVETLARLGYASIAAVYAIVGIITLGAAFGSGGTRQASSRGAFDVILRQPFGQALLVLVAIGMLGYSAWRYVSALRDTENRGSDAKGLAVRGASFFRGLFYTALAVEAFRMLAGTRSSGGNQTAQHWAARLMEKPFGRWLILAAGLGVIGAGLYQLWRAWKSKLGKKLHIEHVSESFRRKVVAVSRFGIAARAAVFLLIGASIVMAAWKHRASEAANTQEALRQVGSASHWLLAVIAVGFIAYGVYQLLNARYRVIRA